MDPTHKKILSNVEFFGSTLYFYRFHSLRVRYLERQLSSYIYDLICYAQFSGIYNPLNSPNLRSYCEMLQNHLIHIGKGMAEFDFMAADDVSCKDYIVYMIEVLCESKYFICICKYLKLS